MKSYGTIATICLSMHMCEALNIGNFNRDLIADT